MTKNSSRKIWIAAAAATLPASFAGGVAHADVALTTFTPGDLVVLRGGDATNTDSTSTSTEVSAYLDEYTTAGAYVGSVPVGTGLTLPGYATTSHEGVLNLSGNGQYLSFAGYTNAAGGASQPANATQTESIGLVGNAASSLNTSTQITPAEGTGAYIRSAYTLDGNEFYVGAKNPNDGLQYVSGVGPSATVTTLESTTDFRDVIVSNGTLYGGTGSSSVGAHGAYQIGTTGSLPKTATPANTLITSYPGGNSASGIALADISTTDAAAGTSNGNDVLYTIGDQSTAGITKYYYNGSSWVDTTTQVTLNSNNVINPTGLAVTVDPTNSSWTDIYVSGENGIYSYVDKSGDPTAALPANAFTPIVTPSANEVFDGLAFAPAPAAVPEPASLGLLGLGILALRRRRA